MHCGTCANILRAYVLCAFCLPTLCVGKKVAENTEANAANMHNTTLPKVCACVCQSVVLYVCVAVCACMCGDVCGFVAGVNDESPCYK